MKKHFLLAEIATSKIGTCNNKPAFVLTLSGIEPGKLSNRIVTFKSY